MKRRQHYRYCMTVLVGYCSQVKCHCQKCVLDLLFRQALMSLSMSLFKTSVARITRIPPRTAAVCRSHSRRFHDVFLWCLLSFAFKFLKIPEACFRFAAHFSVKGATCTCVCEVLWRGTVQLDILAKHISHCTGNHDAAEYLSNTVVPRSFGVDLIH